MPAKNTKKPVSVTAIQPKKHILVRIIEHQIFGILLTFSGISLTVVLFILITNFRNLIYPLRNLEQDSPKQFVEKVARQLPTTLPKPEIIEHGSRFKHQIAITFDADMTQGMLLLLKKGVVKSWYNSQVVDLLRQNKIKATFFLTGLWVKTYPQEAKQLAQDPLFELGNHSYSHPAFTPNCFHLPVIDNTQDSNEVEKAQKEIKAVTGVEVKYFRFPGGCYDKTDLETVSKLGLTVIHWDLATGDAFNKSTESIVQRTLPRVQNGSILVFHLQGGTNAPKTAQALAQIIPQLKKQGYEFVTISELLSN